MKISTRGRYGARAMLDLAFHNANGPIYVKDIAARQEISERYLENILVTLRVAGLVRSARGARGGFILAKPPDRITIGEIVKAIEGTTSPVACVGSPEICSRQRLCVLSDVWTDVKNAIDNVLDTITLQELVERHKTKLSVVDLRDRSQARDIAHIWSI